MERMGSVSVGLWCVVLLVTAEGGAPMTLTTKEHPWGSFLPNSFCVVQTTTIDNIDGRAVPSSKTVRMVLKAVDRSGITLEETETLELGGRIIPKQPQTIHYDVFQERIQENVRATQGEPVKLMIGHKGVPCAVRIYEQQTSGGHLTTTIWFTSQVFPYVLRVEKILRSSSSGEKAGGQIIRESVTLVQETSALRNPRGARRNRTYTLQTVEKAGNITKTTDARCSWDYPGGLLEATTVERDAQNREIRRAVSRMINYHVYELKPVPTQRNRTSVPVGQTY
jgi:hypothetical protein